MSFGKFQLAIYLFLTSIAAILILLAVTFFNDYSNVNSILLNLATEILGAVLLFLLLEKLFELSTPLLLKDFLSNSGLNDCYEKCPVKDMLSDISSSTGEILILQTWVSNDRELQSSLKEAFIKGARARILFLKPNSSLARYRNEECKFEKGVVTGRINVVLKSFYNFKKLNNNNIKLRIYDGTPTFALFVSDQNAYLMPYFRKTTSYESPCFKVSRQKEMFLSKKLIEHFDAIWENEATDYSIP